MSDPDRAVRKKKKPNMKAVKKHTVRTAKRAHQSVKKIHAKTAETARVAGETMKRLFRINLANTLTLLNGVAGFLSIIASMQGRYHIASGLILAGVLFDWLDGKAARFFNEESALGRELDSLSDLISFGVAPATLVASIAPSLFSYSAGALFVLSAALRLGRFNVQKLKGVFFGLPTTANGVLLPALVFFGVSVAVYPWYLLAVAFLMNVPIRMKKVL